MYCMSDQQCLLKNTNYDAFHSVIFSILLLHLRNYKYSLTHFCNNLNPFYALMIRDQVFRVNLQSILHERNIDFLLESQSAIHPMQQCQL